MWAGGVWVWRQGAASAHLQWLVSLWALAQPAVHTPCITCAPDRIAQEAAGMFSHLKESEAAKVDNPRPVDLSPECLSMMEKLMLAQAQV